MGILDQSVPHLIRVFMRGGDMVIEQDGNEVRFPPGRAAAVAILILQVLDHYGGVEVAR